MSSAKVLGRESTSPSKTSRMSFSGRKVTHTQVNFSKEDKTQVDWKDVLQQAEALFARGEYDQALVWFHRGRRLRPKIKEFAAGIVKCERAIEMKKGSISSPMFHFSSLSPALTIASSTSGPADSSRASTRLSSNISVGGGRTPTRTPNEPHPPVVARPISRDRLNQSRSSSTDKPLNANMESLEIEDSFKFRDTRTTFWKQQMPSHAMRALQHRQFSFGNNGVREELTLPRLNSRESSRSSSSTISHYLAREVHKTHQEFLDGRYEECVVRADRCLQTMQINTTTDLLKKYEMLSSLYNVKGNALFQQALYKDSLKCFYRDLELAKDKDMIEAKARALENIGRVYARVAEFDTAIKFWREKLPFCKNEAERSWLYHELGYCYLSKKDYSRAKHHGELAYAAADNAGDLNWQLFSSLLIAQSEAMLDDLQNALDTFKYAADVARVLGDKADQQHIHEAITGIQNVLSLSHNKPPLQSDPSRLRKSKIIFADFKDEEDTEAKEVTEKPNSGNLSATNRPIFAAKRHFLRAVPDTQKSRNRVNSQEDVVVHITNGRASVDQSTKIVDNSVEIDELEAPFVLQGGGLLLRQRSFQGAGGRLSKQSNYRQEEKQVRAQFMEKLLHEREQQIKNTLEIPTFAEPTKGILKNNKIRQMYSDIDDPSKSDYQRLFPAIAHTNVQSGNANAQPEENGVEDVTDSSKKNTKSVRFRENTDTYHLPEMPPEEPPPLVEIKRLPFGKVQMEGYFIGKYA